MQSPTVESILGKQAIADIAKPVESARGLPAAAYTSQAFFDLEQQRLFPRTWVGVAFAEEIPQPGDAMPVVVAGVPLILLRDGAGTVRAFHNVCRHRATIILDKPATKLRSLQCPYHAWTYGLDGALKATPFWDGTPDSSRTAPDTASNGLVPVRCGVWNHVIFVNLDGKAPPLADYVRPVDRFLADLDLDGLRLAHRHGWEFKANWKLVNDNWENYHHVWVHEGVFDKMSEEVDLGTGESYTEMSPEGSVLVLRRKDSAPSRQASAPLAAHAMPPIATRPGAAPFRGCTGAVLPNTTVTIGISSYAPAIYTPIAPGLTRVSMAWYFVGDAATDRAHAAGREKVLDRWLGESRDLAGRTGIRSQDHWCMELQQAARGSPVADQVQFSPTWERNVHYFEKWVVDRLAEA
ncbi:MAG: aromatic ring-hydroxylating dioxygenase subunit alpha [Alphaproteobacteria bacterium]|nr:aromatic ring-hydroxylating dioxygenase subunit alpha [Alphaproteobacteria bacterium]